MQAVVINRSGNWARYLDNVILICASLVPLGIVVGNAGFESLIALTGLAWLVQSIILKQNPFLNIYKNQAVIAWFAWLTIIILSMAINGPGSKGAAHDIVFLRFFLFGCAVIDISYRRNITKKLAWGLVIGVLFGAFNMMFCYIFGSDLFGHDLIRYTGKLKEAARLAGLCSMALPFIFLWCITTFVYKNIYSWILFFVSLISIIVVNQTTIRTALLASVFSIFIGVFFYRYKKNQWFELILWGFTILFGFLFAYILIQNGSIYTGSIHDRIGIWKVAFAMWSDHIFIGVGVSSFQDYYAEIAASGKVSPFISPTGLLWLSAEATHAHNLILMLLSSTGLIGLFSFLWLFVCCCVSITKSKVPWKYGLYTWPFVFMILGLTGWNIYHSWYHALFSFFVVLAITSGNNRHTSIK